MFFGRALANNCDALIRISSPGWRLSRVRTITIPGALELRDAHIAEVADLLQRWQTVEQRSSVVTTQLVATNDYNLSPSRYISSAAADEALPLEEAVRLLREDETERAKADEELWKMLAELSVE